jgi:integrase/recombinase XerD
MGKQRDLMSREMALRNLSETTKKAYLTSMKGFIGHYMKCPTTLGVSEIKSYMLYLKNGIKHGRKKNSSPKSINRHLGGILFYYHHVLNRQHYRSELPRMKTTKKVPVVFSVEEIRVMIDSLYNIQYKSIFMTLYSAGLRSSELQNLRPSDIDSERMVINIRNAKGGKDRQALLSPMLLKVLRTHWKLKPNTGTTWLFTPTRNPVDTENLDRRLSHTTVHYVLKVAAKAAGIKKKSILTH